MKVILFGATGMIGQGVLRECLLDLDIDAVETIGRTPTRVPNGKLREIVHADLFQYMEIEDQMRGFDACFFCLGKTSAGTCAPEPTNDVCICFRGGRGQLGEGIDDVGRVKGKTENAILALPFKAACAFRPAAIVAMSGEQSRTTAYRVMYTVLRPLVPLLRRLFPGFVVTTEEIGRAMIRVAKYGPPKRIMESADIGALARK